LIRVVDMSYVGGGYGEGDDVDIQKEIFARG
jgi:hypothetical protein